MKSKRGPGRPKKKHDGAAAAVGQGGGSQTDADPGVKGAGADRGRQPEGAESEDERTIHNGSAGAFEATEDGHYEEDSDEDNDDFALEH